MMPTNNEITWWLGKYKRQELLNWFTELGYVALVPLLWHLRLEKLHLGSLTNIVLNVFQHYERGDLLLRKVLVLGQSRISLTALQNT